jgi:predicted phosphoadenosine phosphosulfate sulfurtransferase
MLRQRYTGETVLEAAQRRITWIFDRVEAEDLKDIIVSISGGKDSEVLAHLALCEAARRGQRIGIHLLDEEVMYQSSVDVVEYLMHLMPDHTKKMWVQVPFYLTNATSLTEGQLTCWEPGQHKIWMRPKRDDAIKARPWRPDQETVRDKAKGFGFYDAIDAFARCYENTAFLVGLRAAGESPNRWRAVVKNPVEIGGEKVFWGTRKGPNVALYPIFDWNFHDVWKYIWQEKLRYSKIYDLQHKKGYPITEMRVSSLIHERSFKSIADLPEFEPKTYARLQKRIKGIALAQETAKSAKLFACRKLPKNFKSWRAYRDFLLLTYPDPTKKPIFEARFARHLDNEYVARQQCRQLVCNDYENNLAVDSRPDPRDELIAYYEECL